MRFVKQSARKSPLVSLVLLDWSVRESFHLLHYLQQQSVARDDFEVIIIEYYSRVSEAVKKFEAQVDTWLVLDMPLNCYYHKHLMYNAGILVAHCDIIMIGDSDAMVKPTFIESIIKAFESDSKIVYHIDQFRNLRRDFYPFNYPSFEDVLGDGCINNINGKTAGVLNTEDPIHSRNYGACMCAKREDLIAIGGADMHIDYLGHICGPYDMTFRLSNYGRQELWDDSEFTYHTWHPGQAGADNYLGPHDGRHMSTTALEALTSGRIVPLSENEAIKQLRVGAAKNSGEVLEKLIPVDAAREWDLEYVQANASHLRFSNYKVPLGAYMGFRLTSELGRVFAYPVSERGSGLKHALQTPAFEGATEQEVKLKIDEGTSKGIVLARRMAAWYIFPIIALEKLYNGSQRLPVRLSRRAKALFGFIAAPLAFVIFAFLAPAPLIGRLRRLRRTSKKTAEELAQFSVALNNMLRWGVPNDGDALPTILVNGRRMILFLRLLQLMKLAPPAMIRRVADAETLRAALFDLEQKNWSGQLLIPAELFNNFHAIISPAAAAQRLVVV
jgi:hypothetical protein